ncbi:MAG: cyclic pyranopterin monophosphate synthase MoaC [Ruminococcus sp.]|nr:cyclic pyranopterin monophosphate synthase MoaC [Ruminococcus sp.]
MDFSHFNEQGRAKMVDVTEKEETFREAIAEGKVLVSKDTMALIKSGGIKKGDVLTVAQVAGIMAAKKTSEIIPMCHPLTLSSVDIHFETTDTEILITATAKCKGSTGVEMEALTAVSAAALTVYDMCKAVQRDIEITDIRLIKKSGGKSGVFLREVENG